MQVSGHFIINQDWKSELGLRGWKEWCRVTRMLHRKCCLPLGESSGLLVRGCCWKQLVSRYRSIKDHYRKNLFLLTLYYSPSIIQPTIWNDVFSTKMCCFAFHSNWCHCWLGVNSHCCLKSPDFSTLSWYVYIWWASIKGAHVFHRVMALCDGCAAQAHQLHSRKALISAQIAAIAVSKSPPNCLGTFNNRSPPQLK